MKKRVISFVLIMVMVIGFMPTLTFAASTTEFAGGSGTEADPYLIETKYHLDNVRNYLDAHFKMIADIEFTDADFKPGGDFYNNGVGWNPIGRFNGVFDGNNYVIKNIYIRNSSTSDISYIGFFGFNKGKITNLGIIDGDISEYSSKCDYVGGIAGYNYYGEISKCYYEGTISASSSFYVAGIIGYNEFGKINNCYNTSNITSSFHNAGITGNNYYGTITNCYNTGNIKCLECSESYHYTGGIVAKNYGTVKNCYNTGIISSYSYIGGIVGDNYSSVTNCYNTGNIINLSSVISSYDHIGAIVGHNNSSTIYCTINNCYYSCFFMNSFSNGIGGINNGSSTETPIEYTIEQMKIKSNYIGFDFNNVWEFVEGNSYPYPTLKNNEYFFVDENAEFQGGDGSESAPYLIASTKQLNNVRKYLNAHFILVRDIEFTDADFAEGGVFYNNGQGWIPIGTDSFSEFTGTFDGNGHIIKNLYINISSSYDVYAGLFGYNEGTIKNLGIVDGTVSAISSSNYAFTGGIAGYNQGTIINCYNTGSVSASSSSSSAYAGGIAGHNSSETIENCYNTGAVLASSSGTITKPYSGGIVGYSYKGTVENCYNVGIVSASSLSRYAYAGGIAGSSVVSTITNCYFLNTIPEGVGDGTDTTTKYTADELKKQSTFVGFDFENVWTMAGNECYPYAELQNVKTISDHYFDNACDTNCDCGHVRTITHNHKSTFDTENHFDKCIVCGDIINEQPHEFDNACDKTCDCGYARTITHDHQPTYDNDNHFDKCTVCGDVINTKTHKFENNCDTSCDCGYVRAVTHDHQPTFDTENHFDKCTVCGDVINIKPHVFENLCDTTCDCGYIRAITHNHQPTYDKDNHFDKCTVCSDVINIKPHVFENLCDTACDCGYTRTITHNHQPTYDTRNHFDKCTVCGDVINTKAHEFDNACDKDCACGYTREITHDYKDTYNAASHFEECTVCGSIGDGAPHEFDNACDKDCACGYTRITTHKYDNSCDTNCNVCDAIRTITHSFGAYIYNKDATYEKDGTRTRTCSVCGKTETVVAEGTKKTLINTSFVFTDIPAKKWFKEYVDYSVTYGIFSGTSANTFSPNDNITRAQFVQVLANLEGVDTSNRNIDSGFTDVPKGKWYTAAVTWAAKNGIVNGVGAGKFDPNANVIREQMCVMLTNYAKFKGITLKAVEAKENFADDGKISKWAKDAVYTCQQADIVNGKGAGMFDPKGTGTRAEACVIFTKFHKDFVA